MNNFIAKFYAKLYLKLESEGGRRIPIPNGFKTDIWFKDGQFRISLFEFESDFLMPGQLSGVNVNVLLHSEDEINYLLEMKNTYIADGKFKIGDVELIDLLDSEKR